MSQTKHMMRESINSLLDLGVDVVTIKEEDTEGAPLNCLPAKPKNILNKHYSKIRAEELKPKKIKIENYIIHNEEKELTTDVQIKEIKEEILEDNVERQRRNDKCIDVEIDDNVGALRNEQNGDLYIKISCTKSDIVFNSDDDKSYHCGVCKFKTANQKTIIKHVQTHSDENNLSKKVSIDKCTVHRNKISHTNKRLYLCSHCKYTSSNKAHLTMHNRQHTGEKPYACEHCDYRSGSKSNLTRHNSQHTSEKPYACDHCEYRSSFHYNLVGHMRQHTGEKPYECKHCDYKSSSQTGLNRHIRQHSGEKPYACDHCGYRSFYKANLNSHSRKHTGEKPYSCDECDYRSIQKAHLLNHMKKSH